MEKKMQHIPMSSIVDSNGVAHVGKNMLIIDDLPKEANFHLFIGGNDTHVEFFSHICPRDGDEWWRRHCTFHLMAKGVILSANIAIELKKNQRMEWSCKQEHEAENATSHVRVRSIMDGKAFFSASSTIVIAGDANGSAAHYDNRNLLLSHLAHVVANPSMEISLKNAFCSHGATIGGTDPQQESYLCSRGISSKNAKLLLRDAFIREICGPMFASKKINGDWEKAPLRDDQ
ncbi:MAG: SufD family Fe-S cluster assembly protein [Puniceicoccales bacterium]|jgi:hypothetical protein|nr:SufD family Fe-S cluster assembly protein [Puniceicoccales bacterium]